MHSVHLHTRTYIKNQMQQIKSNELMSKNLPKISDNKCMKYFTIFNSTKNIQLNKRGGTKKRNNVKTTVSSKLVVCKKIFH